MIDDRRKQGARWWEFLVPVFVLVVSLNALPTPLGNAKYALAGVLLSAAAAWSALALWRRCGLAEFLERLMREHDSGAR